MDIDANAILQTLLLKLGAPQYRLLNWVLATSRNSLDLFHHIQACRKLKCDGTPSRKQVSRGRQRSQSYDIDLRVTVTTKQ